MWKDTNRHLTNSRIKKKKTILIDFEIITFLVVNDAYANKSIAPSLSSAPR